MVVQSSQNINQENKFKNKINCYRFDNILISIIIIIDKIITFIKTGIFKRKEKGKNEEKIYYYILKASRNTFSFFKKGFFSSSK